MYSLVILLLALLKLYSFFVKDAGYSIKIHHLEYMDGGILDPDDVLIDVVEDKDKVRLHFSSH